MRGKLELEHNAKEEENKHCVVQKWIKDMTKIGMAANAKLNYTILRTSLKARLIEAKCTPLRPHAIWLYARQIMDSVLPVQCSWWIRY